LLRGLTPLTKLATARWAVATAAEVMESIGGVGYCEDSGIPAYVRNTHVLPIWEGTTNVLSLDFLRAVARSGALDAMEADVRRTLEGLQDDGPFDAATAANQVVKAFSELAADARVALEEEAAQAWARRISLGLATTYACARLLAQGEWAARQGNGLTIAAAMGLLQRGLVPPRPLQDVGLAMDEELTSLQ
jgi:hypothetical protein